ncbi:MAG: fused MFS/spermidine synthase [Myxococcota bacterium]|nr:fused MFS/spermidine synthase [Myxococcota bacterium]
MPRRSLYLLFFGSGASGLVYQVLWMRALSLTMSVSVYAATTVLCAFMAGLALGSMLAGRIADRLERPFAAFGLAEVGVGLTGFFALELLFGLAPAEIWIHDAFGGGGVAMTFARFLVAFAVLVIPCTLMGATLPFLSRALVDDDDAIGRGTGALYAVNTFGAVAGCVTSGFLLIPSLGLASTNSVAAALNVTVGLVAIALGRGVRREVEAPSGAVEARRLPRSALLITLGFGVSGFIALGYEVLWTRALEQFTHNSTYAYTAMLGTFLVGIASGSAVASRWADRSRRPDVVFGRIQIGIAVSVLISLLFYMRLLHWMPAIAGGIGGLGSWWRVIVLIFSVTGLTLFSTTFLFGATFPFVTRAIVESQTVVGRRVAQAYSINTLGSIFGSVTIGFLLLPWLGMAGTFVALILANLALGTTFALGVSGARARATTAAVAAACVAGSFLLIPGDLFRAIFAERYGELLMYKEQITDIVMVTEDELGQRLIRYGDGRGTAGTSTVHEDRSYAHFAMLPHENPKNVLSICFGVGNSLSSLTQYPVERIDAVELSPGVVEAAPYFEATNRNVLSDPRVHLTIQDGRNFLLTTDRYYDVIRLDPPELHTAGVVNLYTREFFELARSRLAEGGIFSIWVNVSYTPEDALRMVMRTAADVFPHVQVWRGPYFYGWVINGSMDPNPPDLARIGRGFAREQVRSDLASIGVRNPYEFLGLFVMGDKAVRAFAGDAPVLTDNRTRLDFDVPKARESSFGVSNHITGSYLKEFTRSHEASRRLLKRYCRYMEPVLPHVVNAAYVGVGPVALARNLERVSNRGLCAGMRASNDPGDRSR